jgi:UDP-N-acetylmuramate-alanine ligase
LARAIQVKLGNSIKVQEVGSLEEAQAWVLKNKRAGDLILTLGAGSITKLSDQIAKKFDQTKD